MAAIAELVGRDFVCGYGYRWTGSRCVRRSGFYYWGRWVLLGITVVGFIIFLFALALIARRRRRRGVQPMYGTGWMAPSSDKWGNQQNGHEMYNYNTGGYGQNAYQQPHYGSYPSPPPPPAYGQQQQPQYTGTTFNSNDGYYGQQYSGVQQPQGVYQRSGEDNYVPPAGPPPGK